MRMGLRKNDAVNLDGPARTARGFALLFLLMCGAWTAARPDGPDKPAASPLRRTPEVLLPSESRVALTRLQLPTLIFDRELAFLLMLKHAPNDGPKGDEDYESEWVKVEKTPSRRTNREFPTPA